MIETDIVVSAGLRITCAKDELAQALGVVSRALSTRSSVQILSGILLEARAGELRLAATDMELSLRASLAAQIEGDGSIVLPGKTLVDIARLLPGDEVTIEHKPAESVVHVTAGTASYTLNTYNPEDFPRLPELEAVSTFSVERESLLDTIPRVELLEVIRRASVMIQRATPLQLRFAEGELTVIARTHEVGESQESLPVAYTGDVLEIGFNADFLRDGLELLDSDDVRVKLISPLRPAVIQGEGDDFTYLVMPIRLPG